MFEMINVMVAVWEEEPLVVREGGTLPITALLMAMCNAPAIHVPLGVNEGFNDDVSLVQGSHQTAPTCPTSASGSPT
jgi:hypothetical protein